MRILLVASHPELCHALRQVLVRQSWVVDSASDGEIAWNHLRSVAYETVVIDASADNPDGFTLCRRLRAVGYPVPILLLLAEGTCQGLESGLEMGADACLQRPFTERLLLAQVRALGRCAVTRRAVPSLSWGGLVLDPIGQRVTYGGRELRLHRKEYQILQLLLNHPKKVFSQQELAERLWHSEAEAPSSATVRSHIRGLRKTLTQFGAGHLLQTKYGQGYRLDPSACPLSKAEGVVVSGPAGIAENLWQELMSANARLKEEMELREALEAQLRRVEAMSMAAQRVAQIGCWEIDLATGTIFWTDELFLIHGLTPGDPPPTPEQILALLHPDDLEIHERQIRQPARRGEPFEANLRIIRPTDGQVRHLNARGGPVFDSQGVLRKLIGTTLDITGWIRVDSADPVATAISNAAYQ